MINLNVFSHMQFEICSFLYIKFSVLEPTNMLDLNAIIWLENYLQVS